MRGIWTLYGDDMGTIWERYEKYMGNRSLITTIIHDLHCFNEGNKRGRLTFVVND
jgi:hypothetical protein